MNALPVGPHQVAEQKMLKQYFDDIDRWKFDVAYNAYYALPYDEVIGPLRDVYAGFAEEAKRRGIPACIQIQSTVCRDDKVSIAEAQYHLDNTPDKLDKNRFFASFASMEWKDYLKELTTFFIEECGFEWVVYEEPMYRVDIPGTNDRFFKVFKERYPELSYPESHEETESYLAVQRLKADILVEFFDDLTAHAKTIRAKKVGIMPWFFIPTVENTPSETLNTSCDIGRINALENLDFLVVRMQPDNILCDVLRTGDDMQRSPLMYYPEVLAHALGKPVMVVNNPTDEHTDYPKCPLIPIEFFKKATLASLAAAPNGMTRHWYTQNYGADEEHMEFMQETNAVISRLGNPTAPVAFVFSYSGGRHAEPATYEKVWQSYWALAKRMLFDKHQPMFTLYADTLVEDLASHPEIQVLVLEEQFPLTAAQAMAVRKWWLGSPKRAIVIFATNAGYSVDVRKPGVRSVSDAFHGLLPAFGIKDMESAVPVSGDGVMLKYVGGVKRSTFLGESITMTGGSVMTVNRAFGSGARVLYANTDYQPVIVEMRQRGSLGVFCGVALSEATADIATKAVGYALKTIDAPPPAVIDCSKDVLWNETRGGYIVVANCSTEPGLATLNMKNSVTWDVVEKKEFEPGIHKLVLDPLSFKIFRRFARRSKLLDIEGAVWVKNIIDGAGRADISLMSGRRTAIWFRVLPREILVDGEVSLIKVEWYGESCCIDLPECPPGEHEIVIKW